MSTLFAGEETSIDKLAALQRPGYALDRAFYTDPASFERDINGSSCADYDAERPTWLWDATARQDKKITVDNQLGVNSRFYRPGPYSDGEAMTARVTSWYLEQIT